MTQMKPLSTSSFIKEFNICKYVHKYTIITREWTRWGYFSGYVTFSWHKSQGFTKQLLN